jgi:hypothetical protein
MFNMSELNPGDSLEFEPFLDEARDNFTSLDAGDFTYQQLIDAINAVPENTYRAWVRDLRRSSEYVDAYDSDLPILDRELESGALMVGSPVRKTEGSGSIRVYRGVTKHFGNEAIVVTSDIDEGGAQRNDVLPEIVDVLSFTYPLHTVEAFGGGDVEAGIQRVTDILKGEVATALVETIHDEGFGKRAAELYTEMGDLYVKGLSKARIRENIQRFRDEQ